MCYGHLYGDRGPSGRAGLSLVIVSDVNTLATRETGHMLALWIASPGLLFSKGNFREGGYSPEEGGLIRGIAVLQPQSSKGILGAESQWYSHMLVL